MTEEINVIYYDDNGNVLHLNQLDRPINDHSNINVYNNTEVDDRQYIGISIIFNLLVCGLFISFVKSVYDKIMICQYNNNRRVISDLEKTIRSIEKDIKKDKEELYKKCPHKWVPDHSYNNYDRTPYICNICNLDS